MTKLQGCWLDDLTWPEVAERFALDMPVLVPVGAAAKAHGPHLPLRTDAMVARALAQRVVDRLPLICAPVLGIGHYPAFSAFAGSQSLSKSTFQAVMTELLAGLRAQGARRLVILNTGVSTEGPLEAVAAGSSDVLLLHMRALGRSADRLFDVVEGGHADERETSVVLALDPRSVRMDRVDAAGPFERTGATGDPRTASAFKGERLLAQQADDAVAAIARRWPGLGPASS